MNAVNLGQTFRAAAMRRALLEAKTEEAVMKSPPRRQSLTPSKAPLFSPSPGPRARAFRDYLDSPLFDETSQDTVILTGQLPPIVEQTAELNKNKELGQSKER